MVVRPGSGRFGLALSDDLAKAYDQTGEAWQRGPARLYDRLAETVLDAAPLSLAGARVLDLGAGTGAVTRAAMRRGAEVIAVDVAFGMLRAGAAHRPPAAVGDAYRLPLATGAFDIVIAAFSLNHLASPEAGLREAKRVLRIGGVLVVAAYSEDDANHPAKDAVERAASARGWSPPSWYRDLRSEAVPRLATVERAAAAADAAGLADALVSRQRVEFPRLSADDLVAWRMGMAHLVPFVAGLERAEQEALAAESISCLTDTPPLVRSLILLTYRASP